MADSYTKNILWWSSPAQLFQLIRDHCNESLINSNKAGASNQDWTQTLTTFEGFFCMMIERATGVVGTQVRTQSYHVLTSLADGELIPAYYLIPTMCLAPSMASKYTDFSATMSLSQAETLLTTELAGWSKDLFNALTGQAATVGTMISADLGTARVKERGWPITCAVAANMFTYWEKAALWNYSLPTGYFQTGYVRTEGAPTSPGQGMDAAIDKLSAAVESLATISEHVAINHGEAIYSVSGKVTAG